MHTIFAPVVEKGQLRLYKAYGRPMSHRGCVGLTVLKLPSPKIEPLAPVALHLGSYYCCDMVLISLINISVVIQHKAEP